MFLNPVRLLSDYVSMKEEKSDWIFYLKLSRNLPEYYFDLDSEFKAMGLTLIPISISELISITKGEGKFNVFTGVRNFDDAQYYTKRVEKMFGMLMRSRRMSLFMTSSFSFINQNYKYGKTGMYHFFPLPQSLKSICGIIASEVDKSSSQDHRWPGSSVGLGKTIR